MYCKKCGTKQKEGQKFCSKCGTPYSVIEKPKSVMQPVNPSVGQKQTQTPPPVNNQTSPTNGQATPPPPMNNQKTTPPPVSNLTDKAEDTFEQGKKFVKENVQPQLDKGIEKLKSTDWKEKVNQATDAIKNFDVKKVKKNHWIYAGIGCVALFVGSMFFCLFMLIACNGCGGINLKKTNHLELVPSSESKFRSMSLTLYPDMTYEVHVTLSSGEEKDYNDKYYLLDDSYHGEKQQAISFTAPSGYGYHSESVGGYSFAEKRELFSGFCITKDMKLYESTNSGESLYYAKRNSKQYEGRLRKE